MKQFFRLSGLSCALLCLLCAGVAAQTPTPAPFVVQVTAATPAPVASPTPVGSADVNAYTGGISGNGRFIVFESKGDLATIAQGQTTRTPGNADGNREIFLWDAAQRRIFQLTDTRSALVDNTKNPFDQTNVAVEVSNNRPQISRDGRWLVFSSNAATPGSFDGTTAGNKSALQADGNQELFLYRIPDAPAASLTSGVDPGFLDLRNLNGFTRVTNTPASASPRAGGANAGPFVADDNRAATINDTGSRIAFVSTRNLPTTNSRTNTDANPEIYAYNRLTNAFTQITLTSGTLIFNDTPAISGGTSDDAVGENQNSTIAFYSNATTMPGTNGANVADNADGNSEVFVANFDGVGLTSLKEVTRTKSATAGQVVNALTFGQRVSRNGNLIAFESLADDPAANVVPTLGNSTVFVYNVTTSTLVPVGPRAASTEAGDITRFPTFTGDSARLVFASNLNLKADATRVDAGDATGLNPTRNVQLFTVPVPATATTALVVTRLTSFATGGFIQFAVSNTIERIAFSIPSVELGGGNGTPTTDFSTEVYYLVAPPAPSTSDTAATASALAYATGASRNAVATPVASPTPTPSPTPTTTPLAGLAPGMMAVVNTTAQSGTVTFAAAAQMVGCVPANANCDAASESHRQPALPFELNGVSLSIANAAAGLYFVSPNEIQFEVPRGLPVTTGTNTVPVVINIREAGGVRTVRSLLQIVPAQPDIFTTTNGPGGRAVISNVTNPLVGTGTPEPFTVTTTYADGTGQNVTAPTRLRLALTGVRGIATSQITVRLVKVSDNTNTDITGASVVNLTTTDMPGLSQLDFLLPASLAGAGDVAVVVIVTGGATSRAADTAPRFRIN